MQHYFQRFSALIAELLEHEEIEVQKFELKSGYPFEYLSDLENDKKITLAKSIKEFYSQISRVEIIWMKRDDYSLNGEIFIQNIDECLQFDNQEEFWQRRYRDHKQPEWEEKFKPFDYFNSDETEITGFIQEGKVVSDKMAYFKSDAGFGELNITLEEYFDHTFKTRGLRGWQEALWVNDYKNIQDTLNKLFHK